MDNVTKSPSIDARIAAATVPGFPVVSRRALREARVHRDRIAIRVADARFHELWPGMFLDGVEPRSASREFIRAAAVECVGPRAAIDGAAALERHGVWDRHDGTIQVVSTRGHAPIPKYQITFRRERAFSSECVNGIATRLALEALFIAAETLTPHQLAYVIERSQYRKRFTLEDVERELRVRSGRRWTSRVARALELRREGSCGTKSRSEDRMLPPVTLAYGEPLVNVHGAAGIPDYQPDFCWPDRRWIVEVDGDHHVLDPEQRSKDLARDELLRRNGWIVVRIPWRETKQPSRAMRRVRMAFGR